MDELFIHRISRLFLQVFLKSFSDRSSVSQAQSNKVVTIDFKQYLKPNFRRDKNEMQGKHTTANIN
jgi:hypothetical protein